MRLQNPSTIHEIAMLSKEDRLLMADATASLFSTLRQLPPKYTNAEHLASLISRTDLCKDLTPAYQNLLVRQFVSYLGLDEGMEE